MKISIVTVAFNAEATIAKAVASVVSQRQDGFELEYIIVDGASSDGTLAALNPTATVSPTSSPNPIEGYTTR